MENENYCKRCGIGLGGEGFYYCDNCEADLNEKMIEEFYEGLKQIRALILEEDIEAHFYYMVTDDKDIENEGYVALKLKAELIPKTEEARVLLQGYRMKDIINSLNAFVIYKEN